MEPRREPWRCVAPDCPSTERGALVNDDRPKKSFLKLPDNYLQLSEEERKQWAKEAGASILANLEKTRGESKQQ